MHGHHHLHHHHHAALGGPVLSRRAALGGIGAALTLAGLRPARAGVPFPQRLVIVNMLGGLDGLSAVVPYGDPALMGLRAALVPPAVGQPGGMFDLGGFYGLHPALVNMAAMYQSNQMLAVHAVGGIQATRSHFDDQGVLQAGELGTVASGWMNRLVSLLPSVAGGVEAGVVLGPAMPIISQGPVQIASWQSSPLTATPNTLAALVETLGASDPLIGGPIQSGFNERSLLKSWLAGQSAKTASPLQAAMQAAGAFIASPGGPAVALIQTDSMDTHTTQVSQLQPLLADVDAGMGFLASAAGSVWANTVVLTFTEFGRTAYMNGCGGTEHGTAFAMFLAGGAVAGGRVIANWPGLAPGKLYQNRDLAPTTDVRSVIMGVLRRPPRPECLVPGGRVPQRLRRVADGRAGYRLRLPSGVAHCALDGRLWSGRRSPVNRPSWVQTQASRVVCDGAPPALRGHQTGACISWPSNMVAGDRKSSNGRPGVAACIAT